MRRSVAALLLLAGVPACVTVGGSIADACPESRALRCATPPVCSMDRARGCRVCACEAWDPSLSNPAEKGGKPYAPERDRAVQPSESAPPQR